ncbi:MAG TPA: hypothetical protein VFG10_02805 [Saprospiraceae bacterium]|nr:hypothetical protein [Saprospiraceae bacterium]
MQSRKVISSALTGTAFMTLFSYLVSDSKNKNFREPDVLANLLRSLFPDFDKQHATVAGWSSHLAAGILFTTLYDLIWENTKIKPNLVSGLLFGAASGLVGILIWKISFEAHPHPPIKDLKTYFGHLMLAHLVFGASSAMGYNLVKEEHQFSLN